MRRESSNEEGIKGNGDHGNSKIRDLGRIECTGISNRKERIIENEKRKYFQKSGSFCDDGSNDGIHGRYECMCSADRW